MHCINCGTDNSKDLRKLWMIPMILTVFAIVFLCFVPFHYDGSLAEAVEKTYQQIKAN